MKITTKHAPATLALALSLVSVESGWAFYNPQTGRWLNRDPLEERGAENLYGFAAGNPTTHIDPFGLAPEPSAPDLSPCIYDGFQRARLLQPEPGRLTFARTDYGPRDISPGFDGIPVACDACCVPGVKYSATRATCSITITYYTDLGNPDQVVGTRGSTRTSLQHEYDHAKDLRDAFVAKVAVWSWGVTICVPTPCDSFRLRMLTSADAAIHHYEQYKSKIMDYNDLGFDQRDLAAANSNRALAVSNRDGAIPNALALGACASSQCRCSNWLGLLEYLAGLVGQ